MKGYNGVTVTRSFEAAHMLSRYNGDCKNLHGHSYKVRVTIKQKDDNRAATKEDRAEDGMLIDFREVKGHLDFILFALDHSILIGTEREAPEEAIYAVCQQYHLNVTLIPGHTTAENIALYILNGMAKVYADRPSKINLTVEVQETEGCYATCSRNI